MKPLTTLLLAALLLPACRKNTERRLTLQASGERFRVEASGPVSLTAEANLTWSTTVYAEPGATLTLRACRLPSDYIEPPDSTPYWTDTLNVSLGVLVYLDGNPLADAGATTTHGSSADACATLTYTVPER